MTDIPTIVISSATGVQAVATVLALYLGVWVPRRAEQIALRKERLQARCIAVAIEPDLQYLEVRLLKIRGLLDSQTKIVGEVNAISFSNVMKTAEVEIPPMLDRNVDRLYLLGEPAGPTVLQLISVALQYNAMLDQLASRCLTEAHVSPRVYAGHLLGHMTAMEKLIADAGNELKPIHDPEPDALRKP